MISTIFPLGEFMGSIFALIMQKIMAMYIGDKNNIEYFSLFLRNELHGFLQKYARPKKVCKKISKTNAKQSSLGGVSHLVTLTTTCFFAIQCSFEKTSLNLLWFELSTCGIPFHSPCPKQKFIYLLFWHQN